MKVMQRRGIRTIATLLAAVVALFILAGGMCDPSPTAEVPQSGSGMKLVASDGTGVPTDTKAYSIKGWVAGDINSIVRQSAPAQGDISGTKYGIYGSFVGPEQSGKTIVRLHVDHSDYGGASPGDIILLKVEDTKASGLTPGDYVAFKCRAQYEALSATENYQPWVVADGVWEMDYCRVDGVRIGNAPQSTDERRP